MERDKLDKNIKRKLERREVSPKETTWNRLEMLLDEDDKKVGNYTFLKYAVAASVVLFLGLFFFMNQENDTVLPQIIVDVPIENTKIIELKQDSFSTKKADRLKLDNKESQLLKSEQVVAHQAVKKIKVIKVKAKNNNKTVRSVGDNTVVVASVSFDENQEKTAVISGYLGKKKTAENKQLNTEVDDLLAIAFSEYKQEQSKTVVVDKNLDANANALLANVEQELDVSFKAKMFKKLKNGLKNTRTAVINRNQ